MKAETFKGTIERAYGKDLPTAVPYDGTFDAYTDISEVPTADRLSPKDELEVINAARKANARQKAMNDALQAAGIAKPDQNDPAVIRENLVKQNMKLYKVDEATARKMLDALDALAAQAK